MFSQNFERCVHLIDAKMQSLFIALVVPSVRCIVSEVTSSSRLITQTVIANEDKSGAKISFEGQTGADSTNPLETVDVVMSVPGSPDILASFVVTRPYGIIEESRAPSTFQLDSFTQLETGIDMGPAGGATVS